MKGMNKKLVKGAAATMSFALSMMAVPMVSMADDELEPNYGIYVAGVPVIGSNCNDVLGDGTVSYDPETSTLNFNDAVITSGAMYQGNTSAIAIGGDGVCNITGNVSISGVDNGITAVDFSGSTVNIQEGAKIDIDCDYIGITVDNLNIDGAEVDINANAVGSDDAFGIVSNYQIVITNSDVDIFATNTGVSGDCYIDGGSVVSAKTDNCGFWGWEGAFEVADAKVTIDAPVGLQYAYVDVSDDNAVVDITSNYYGSNGPARAIQANEAANLSAGKITLRGNGNGIRGMSANIGTSVTINTEDYGIYAQFVEIYGEDADVKINSNTGAIYTENFMITDAEILVPEKYIYDQYGIYDENENPATEVVIGKAHVHAMKKVDAVEATTESTGNLEYFVCEDCGAAFWDEEGTQPIEDMEEVVIPMIEKEEEPAPTVTPTPAPTEAPSETPAAQNGNIFSFLYRLVRDLFRSIF